MSNQLHPTLEKFYLSILKYAGLKFEDKEIVNIDDKVGDVLLDGKALTLPYFDLLKNPEGRHIFHPLNENYAAPETATFALFKKRLTFELNLKLSTLIISLFRLASDPQLQQRVKSSKMIELLSAIGEVDMSIVEHFVALVKASQTKNQEAFLFDIYLKKNGEINDVPYSAIGKINFHIFHELIKALEDTSYKVYGYKLRKKDVLAISNILQVIFPDIQDKEKYYVGTDHKVFRYLNALLTCSYQVASRLNDIASLLKEVKEPSLAPEESMSDLDWASTLEDVYELTSEIRLIPNQTNIQTEANRLKLREPKNTEPEPQRSIPSFQPTMASQPQPQPQPQQQLSAQGQQPVYQPQPYTQPQAAVQQRTEPPTVEELIRASITPGYGQPPMMMQPQMMQPQPGMAQGWVPAQQPQMMQPQPGMPQGWVPMQPMMQPQPGMAQGWVPAQQPPMMMQQPQMMQPQMPQAAGLQFNPQLMGGRTVAPWN